MTEGSTILVTGGDRIGSHGVLSLRDAGFAAVVLDDLSINDAAAVPPGARNFMQVTDLTRAPVEVLNHLSIGGEVLTCDDGHGHSVRAVLRAAGVAVPVRVGERRAEDPPATLAAAEWIRTVLARRPAHNTLGRIVADALAVEPGMPAPAARGQLDLSA